jgi:hypothetical protein
MDSELDATNAMLKLVDSFGPDGLLQTLFEQCFKLLNAQYLSHAPWCRSRHGIPCAMSRYTYEACIFGKVQQHSTSATSLGEFQKLIGPLTDASGSTEFIVQYSRGTYCYSISAGRQATMVIQCGGADELVSVSEKTTCEYTLVFKSPLACTESDLKRATAEVENLSQPRSTAPAPAVRGVPPNDIARYIPNRTDPHGHFECFDGSAIIDYRNVSPSIWSPQRGSGSCVVSGSLICKLAFKIKQSPVVNRVS